YEILVTHRKGKEVWYSGSDIGNPQPKSDKLLENTSSVVILGQETNSDRTGRLSGQVRVKNEGALEAKNVKIQVTFYGAPLPTAAKKKDPSAPIARTKLSDWVGPLGTGKLKGGEEKVIP